MPPKTHLGLHLHGGIAQYVVDRLITAGRISRAEVARYIADIADEIQQLEARLLQLRGGATPPSGQQHRRPARVHALRDGRAGKALGGTYGGLIRRVPKPEQAQYEKIKARDGIRAAIAALQSRKNK